MNETKYLPKTPAAVFTARVERVVVHDSRTKMHYEYTLRVEATPTGCEFLDLFARHVMLIGKAPAEVFAARLGVGELQLTTTLATLSGAGIREWTDTFAAAVVERLLAETDWKIGRVAEAAHFTSLTTFSRWFGRRYKCAPHVWRWRNER